jgi:hypothetical protein
MDELSMVRELLAAPLPPSPEVTARAGHRLAERIGGPGRPATRRWSRRARWTAGLAAVTAGLAGTLAVTTGLASSWIGHSGGQARSGSGLVTSERPFGPLTDQPAGTYLTALAARVAQAPAGTGRYWCILGISGQLDAIGSAGQELVLSGLDEKPSPVSDYRYTIDARQANDDCFAISGDTSRNVGGYFQDLGAQPATAADAAAWRRDGSPAWHAWYANGQLIPARPGPRQRLGGKPGQQPWGSGTTLPGSPAQLRQMLLASVPAPGDSLVRHEEQAFGESYAQVRDQDLFRETRVLLLDPLPPAVRAAAYQVLATVPGVHMKTGVTDPDGRRGTALWVGSDYSPGPDPDHVIVVDPVSGLLLADEWLAAQPDGVYAVGTLTQYAVWEYPGWSNKLPASTAP